MNRPLYRRLCCSLLRLLTLAGAALLAAGGARAADVPAEAQTFVLEHVAFPEVAGGASPETLARIQDDVLLPLAKAGGLKILYRFQTIPYVIAQADDGALERLKAAPEIVSILPDATLQSETAQSTVAIGADYVQQTLGRTGVGVAVGLIDSGLDSTHPDLAGTLVAGRRQLGADTGSNVQDDYGHGSFLSGVITSDGNLAPRGVAPGAGIVMVKASNSGGIFQVSDAAAGIDWIVANRALFPSLKFINLSFSAGVPAGSCPCNNIGQTGPNADAYTVLRAAINAAANAGILCVAAAGNNGYGANPSIPACFANVISVGAGYDEFFSRAPATGSYATATGNEFPACFDQDASLNSIACFSSRAACLDFIAPGYRITNADLMSRGGVITTFGTSAATAHVTAALALLQGINPNLSAAELVELLRTTAVPTEDPHPSGAGTYYNRIDVRQAALTLLQSAARNWAIYE